MTSKLKPSLTTIASSCMRQVLVFFAVAKMGEMPSGGTTRENPEGLTAAYGKHAAAFAKRLHSGDLTCKVMLCSSCQPCGECMKCAASSACSLTISSARLVPISLPSCCVLHQSSRGLICAWDGKHAISIAPPAAVSHSSFCACEMHECYAPGAASLQTRAYEGWTPCNSVGKIMRPVPGQLVHAGCSELTFMS